MASTARQIMETYISEIEKGYFCNPSTINKLRLIDTCFHEERRWTLVWLHTYQHIDTGELIGVLNEVSADDDDMHDGVCETSVVDVEINRKPSYVVKPKEQKG